MDEHSEGNTDSPARCQCSSSTAKRGTADCSDEALGVSVKALEDAGVSGVVVSHVQHTSQALEAGLQPGDVIQTVNRRPISSEEEFARALTDYSDEPLLLYVRRGEDIRFPVIGVRQRNAVRAITEPPVRTVESTGNE